MSTDKWPSPVYGKREPRPGHDYMAMTWEIFLLLRLWGRDKAPKDCEPFIVGSAAYRRCPRDLDIALIYSYERWLEMVTNYDFKPEQNYPNELEYVQSHAHVEISNAIGYLMDVDVKVHPDHWLSNGVRIPLRDYGVVNPSDGKPYRRAGR